MKNRDHEIGVQQESSVPCSAPEESVPVHVEAVTPADAGAVPPPVNAAPAATAAVLPPADPAAAPLSETVEPPAPAIQALRRFYEQLTLVPADVDTLWKQRGLTAATAEALGYRSNLKSNKALLLGLEKEFPPLVLLDSGLWSQGDKPTDPPKPNAQFYGMSLVEKRDEKGKKVRDAEGTPVIEFVWGDPGALLIPYFDERGDLIHLRPHKGMMKGKSPRLYVARPSRAWRDAQLLTPTAEVKYAVATEGEFKAGAIFQVMGGEVSVGALPGITMAKLLFGDVEEWLESLPGVRQLVVGYDDEEKGDPALPGYQEDKWRRFDAQIWARFLAAKITKEGFDGRVAVLPAAWRNARGKSDWDGRLAQLLDAEYHRLADAGRELGGAALWAAAAAACRADFAAVLRAAVPVRELWQAGMFDSEEERIIQNGVEKIARERALPVGGEDEEIVARRLQRLIPRLKRDETIPPKARGYLAVLAKKYLTVQGGYYIFKKLQESREAVWQGYADKAANTSDADLRRACELALKGMPERVSDFYMKPHYVLRRLNGTRERLVSLHNIHGAKTVALVSLKSAPFAQPSKFREWLLDNISGATWSAGERELNALQADIAGDVSFKEVSEVAVRGHHAASGCWFFGDVVYGPDGREIFADKSGIVWLKQGGVTEAYQLSETDHELQEFCHGTPKMHPKLPVTDEEVALLFREAVAALNQTLGGNMGSLAMGAVLAYGAGPEIFAKHTAFPGLWLHGETNQGKSSVARWLMRLWGYSGAKADSGMPLPDSTKVGISIALQQYGNLPVWLEEYQPQAPLWMQEKIKNAYNRESGIKKTFDDAGTRKILANAIITGIATSGDPQTRSRYVHVQVSEKNRAVNHYDWFEANSPKFYQLGRWIMQHRPAFGALALAKMQEWMASPAMARIDQRARIVHGASYGAFAAMAELLGTHDDPFLKIFRDDLLRHCTEAVTAVRDSGNVNMFWRDLLDALASPLNPFGEGAELLNMFHLTEVATLLPASLTPHQIQAGVENSAYQWRRYRLSFLPGSVIKELQRHLRQSGRELPLDRSDLQAAMKVRPYWVAGGPKGLSQRFGKAAKSSTTCWTIEVDLHELGLQAATDAEFDDSLYADKKKGRFFTADDWGDPRQGDLFKLVEMLLKAGGPVGPLGRE